MAATEPSPGTDVEVVPAAVSDPLVRPLLRELGHEYATRYGEGAHAELARYPDREFTAEHGGVLLLLLERGAPVAGGAFRRYDATTAELKRIWTHSAHRRRGLARRVVAELEREAAGRGYRRIHLTTGPRQPEARGLYLATGYTPLFDTGADPETIGPLPFEKHLGVRGERPAASGDDRPAVRSERPAVRGDDRPAACGGRPAGPYPAGSAPAASALRAGAPAASAPRAAAPAAGSATPPARPHARTGKAPQQ